MKTFLYVATGIIVLTSLVSNNCFSQELPDGPYFGQTPPGITPEIFAKDIISLSNRRETKIIFSPDGTECFIGIGWQLLYTKQENGHWTTPANATFLGSGSAAEPFISPDGNTLFFIRNADIWTSTKDNQNWSAPKKLSSPISTSAEEWHPTVTMDGTLYFCSSRVRAYDIYRSKLEDGKYSEAEKLDTIINSQNGAADPFIAQDESYMIFSSGDQYISYYNKEDNSWTEPQKLGPEINSNNVEYGSYITPDRKYYFFSRFESWSSSSNADLYWIDARAILPDSLTRINIKKEIPKNFNLYQNYPNPFNPSTTIQYHLQKSSHMILKTYNLAGQEIETLVNEFQLSGEHKITWQPKGLASGIYFYKLQTREYSETKKLILQK